MRFFSRLLCVALAVCGYGFAQANPSPLVNDPLVPTSAAPGSAGFELTVNGTGFVAASVVNWNGSPRATTFISSSQLHAAILASDLTAVTSAYVSVTNPAPGGGKSNPAAFNVTLPAPSVGFYATSTVETKACNKTVLQPQIVADFNGDGKPDVAGNTCGSSYLYVSLSNGDGTFQAPIYTPVILYPIYTVAADFNGDGKMDVAYINDANNVAVMLGNGDGTFQAAKNFLTGINISGLAAADFNGDGRLDLVVSASSDNAMDVLLGNGDGTFQPYIASYTGGSEPSTFVVGDFNHDGKIDVAVQESGSSQVTVLFGNGDGTFAFNANYFVTLLLTNAADLNGDGVLDLVGEGSLIGSSQSGIVVMFGNGDGTFQNAVYASTPPAKSEGYSYVGVADMNGDGKPDLWGFGSQGGQTSGFTIFLGNGDGSFQAPIVDPLPAAGNTGGQVVEADFNGDGKPDFQLGNQCSNISCIIVALQSPVVASPTTIAFGTKLIGGHAKTIPVTLTNAGPSAVTISSFTFTGGYTSDFSQTNNCPASLASQASCVIQVGFDPSSENTLETITLTINDSAPGGSQQIAISGTGTYIRETPASLAFGDVAVGQSSTLSVTLTNTKTSALTTDKFYIVPSPFGKEFSQTNTCGKSLAAGASCQVTVTFAPTSTGHAAAKVSVDFQGDTPPEIQLSGTGT